MLTGIVAGPRRWLQTVAASVVALSAQLTSIAGSVNADVLLSAVYAVALALIALILVRGHTRGRLVALGMAGLLAAAAGNDDLMGFPSSWTALSSDKAVLERVRATEPDLWVGLPFGKRVHWSDDHASILPVLKAPW